MTSSKPRPRTPWALPASWRLLLLELAVLAIGAGALAFMGAHIDPKVLALGLNFSPG